MSRRHRIAAALATLAAATTLSLTATGTASAQGGAENGALLNHYSELPDPLRLPISNIDVDADTEAHEDAVEEATEEIQEEIQETQEIDYDPTSAAADDNLSVDHFYTDDFQFED